MTKALSSPHSTPLDYVLPASRMIEQATRTSDTTIVLLHASDGLDECVANTRPRWQGTSRGFSPPAGHRTRPIRREEIYSSRYFPGLGFCSVSVAPMFVDLGHCLLDTPGTPHR